MSVVLSTLTINDKQFTDQELAAVDANDPGCGDIFRELQVLTGLEPVISLSEELKSFYAQHRQRILKGAQLLAKLRPECVIEQDAKDFVVLLK